MNILLIGSGGREHALAWSLADSPLTSNLVIAPGNPGMAPYGEMRPVAADDLDGLCALAVEISADLVVIGPEVPLVDGLADRLASLGIAAFGPSAAAAQLEGSKEFARAFCARHNVPQPAYFPVSDYATACQHIDQLGGFCVIKADGLAAGKGVVVADDAQTAKDAAKSMLDGQFGESGKRLVIEQRISGPEASLFALLDGDSAILNSLYANQQKWVKGSSVQEANENLQKFLVNEGFDVDFEKCINNKEIEDFVLNDRVDGAKNFKVNSTPTIVINDKKFEKTLTYKNLKKALEKLI